MEEQDNHPKGNYKKKKKRSFLQNAKKFGRSGNFGKGRSLSQEEYNYYISVLQQLKIVKEEEEKYSLIKSFFRELSREGEERSLASNQIVSRILDDLLPLAPVSRVVHLADVFQQDLRTLCIDPFASHVVQTLLTLSLKYIQLGATQFDPFADTEEKNVPISTEEKENFNTFIRKVTKFVYNNLDEFIQDTYASHIIRSVLEVCSGVEVSKSIKTSNKSQTSHSLREKATDILTVPRDLSLTLVDIFVRLTKVPNLSDIIYSDCGSAVLQSALLVAEVKEPEHCQTLLQHILEHGICPLGSDRDYELGADIHNVFTNNACVRLLEVMLTSAASNQQKEMYEKLFNKQICHLVKHPVGNFAVQRLFSSWKDTETFGDVYDEVCPTIKEAVSCGHSGVPWSVVQACGKLKSHQSRCLQELMKLLECHEPESKQIKIAALLLYLIPEPRYMASKSNGSLPPLSLHGALIVQELLNFQKPIKVVNSILAMADSEIITMSSSPRGSHVIDAYVKSSTVGEKSREKLINKLRGSYSTLACSKHGSRSLEALWEVANIKSKSQICAELIDSEGKLKSNPFGNIIYTNFQVRLYKRSGGSSDWLQHQNKEDKKRKLFTELLQTDSNTEEDSHKKSKKKKKKEKSIEENIFIDTEGNDT